MATQNLSQVEQLNKKIREQESTIMALRDTISALHVDNMVLKQRLAVSQAQQPHIVVHGNRSYNSNNSNGFFEEQLKSLSGMITRQYNKTVARGRSFPSPLPVGDMMSCLNEIFAITNSTMQKNARIEERRDNSPAFTFAQREDIRRDVFSFKVDAIEGALTTSSETDSKQESGKGVAGPFLSEHAEKESARVKVKKKGFLGLFGRNVDTACKCK